MKATRDDHDGDRSPESEGLASVEGPGRLATTFGHPVDAAAVAACIRGLVDHSGDDVTTVATTLGVEPAWAERLLTGEVIEVDPVKVQRMCLALDSTQAALFGVGPDITSEELESPLPRSQADLRLPAAPLVAEIFSLQDETGDDFDTVARGLGVEPTLLHALVDGEIDPLTGAEARQLSTVLGLSAKELLGLGSSALEAGETGEATRAESPATGTCAAPHADAPRSVGPDGPPDVEL